MNQVTVDEILDLLVDGDSRGADTYLRGVLRERIKAHGIAPPEGYVLVPIGNQPINCVSTKAMLSAVREKDNE